MPVKCSLEFALCTASPRAASNPHVFSITEPSLPAYMKAANSPLTMTKVEDLPETWASIMILWPWPFLPIFWQSIAITRNRRQWPKHWKRMLSARQGSAVSPLFSESLIPLTSQASIREGTKGLGALLPRRKQRGNENPHYVLYFLIAQNLAQVRWTQFSSSRDLRTTHLCKIVFLAQKDPSPTTPACFH